MNTWLSALNQTPTAGESKEILSMAESIESARVRVENLSAEELHAGFSALAPLRLRSSGTLKKGDLTAWIAANEYVSSHVQKGIGPTWEHILEINHILTGKNHRELIRTRDIFLGPWKACEVPALEENLQAFQKDILSSTTLDVLSKAALAQYGLVSLHPFWDANGRTSVLLTDWILNLHGYLPQSFSTQVDAAIAHLPDRLTAATPARAIYKVLINIKRSYEICLRSKVC